MTATASITATATTTSTATTTTTTTATTITTTTTVNTTTSATRLLMRIIAFATAAATAAVYGCDLPHQQQQRYWVQLQGHSPVCFSVERLRYWAGV